jgi:hypothetical protein
MKNLFLLLAWPFCILSACKKDSGPSLDPGNPNNELKAMVSVGGAAPTLHKSNGNSTSFGRYIDPITGDTTIHVSGSIGKYGTENSRSIEFRLINIRATGRYSLKSDPGLTQNAFCTYQIGDVFFSTVFELYWAEYGTPPGTVTIDVLSATEIRGSFTANCSNAPQSNNGINYVQITNGSFKGTFAK